MDLCNFIASSVMRHGGLQIAVSTSGASPALARTIREAEWRVSGIKCVGG